MTFQVDVSRDKLSRWCQNRRSENGKRSVSASPAGSSRVVGFGVFEVDLASCELRKQGRRVRLQAQPYRILELLLERAGEVVTRDELRHELWPDSVFVDFDHGLNNAVARLRHVLGDDAAAPHFIETVPRLGYRFIYPLTADAAPGADAGVGGDRRRGPIRAWLAVAGLLGAAALGYGWYALLRPAVVDSPADFATTTVPLMDTVAVLPFKTLGTGPDEAALALGVTEGVLHRLSSIPALTVIAPTSSGQALVDGPHVQATSRALDATYLVEGRLQRAGQRLRATVRLVNGVNAAQLFSLQFDRPVDDLFAVEDEIARSVAAALEVQLAQARHPFARFGIDAYLTYLQGRALLRSGTVADAERAIERLSHLIEQAPDFAAAYVALADSHRQLGYLRARGPGRSPLGRTAGRQGEALREGALAAAAILERAFERDASMGEAYILRADIKAILRDVAGAEEDYRRGIALSPSYGTGRQHYAEFLEREGRRAEAQAQLERALLLDPLSPWNHYYMGFMHLFSEETTVFSERAERHFLRALEVQPDYHAAIVPLAAIRWYQGRFAEAVVLAERALAIDPQSSWVRWFLVEFYLEMADVAAAREVLLEAPMLAPIQWLALCHYEGELQRAAELLRADPHSRGLADHDVEAYVLRDAALARGELARGVSELRDLPSRPHVPVERDPFRLVTLAQLNAALGNRSEADRLARTMLEFEDRYSRSPRTQRLAHPQAAALALLGRHDEALTLLEVSFERGFRKRWWYVFDREPAFAPLRGSPRFQTLAERARAHAAAERDALERMRERGEAPRRSSTALAMVCDGGV